MRMMRSYYNGTIETFEIIIDFFGISDILQEIYLIILS